MSGQNQHLYNLYMLWCIGGVNGNIGNIVASEGLDAFVHIGRTVVVTMEVDVAVRITGSVLLIIFPMSHNFCITPNETPVSLES